MFMYLVIVTHFLISHAEEIMSNVYGCFSENTFKTPLCTIEKFCKQLKSISISEYLQNAHIVM